MSNPTPHKGLEPCVLCGLRLSHKDWCGHSEKRLGTGKSLLNRAKSFWHKVTETYKQH